MNMQEFAALKEGDRVDNPMSQSSGVVVERKPNGVKVRWGDGAPGRTVEFFYDVQSTSWMHWTLPEDDAATIGTGP